MAGVKYWIWLQQRLCGDRAAALLEHFTSPEEIWRASGRELERFPFLSARQKALLLDKDTGRAEQIRAVCAAKSIRIITYQDADYPASLRALQEPPLVLYTRGQMTDFEDYLPLAVVGTRRASFYGKNIAHTLGWRLGQAGAAVVTGMAEGVDAAASRGVLEAGGYCAAVLGTPVDVCFPGSSRDIYEELCTRGLVLSEYPPGSKTYPANFPARNRIISGLSRGAVLVEAPIKSGSLITARLALEQGKDVFAVPGNIDVKSFEGSNRLIAAGEAKAIITAADVLDEYGWRYDTRFPRAQAERLLSDVIQKRVPAAVDRKAAGEKEDMDKYVTEALGNRGLTAEEIAGVLGVETGTLMMRLTVMELTGKIKSDGGKYYAVR